MLSTLDSDYNEDNEVADNSFEEWNTIRKELHNRYRNGSSTQ